MLHSILDALTARADLLDGKDAFLYIEDQENFWEKSQRISYKSLWEDVQSLAAWIGGNTDKGDRVILCYPPGLDFVLAFFACLYAQVLAVPVYPPRVKDRFDRVSIIAENCQAKIILSNHKVRATFEKYFLDSRHFNIDQVFYTDRIDLDLGKKSRMPCMDSDTPAFLQYTSGSTGAPKGVVITHGNIIANLNALIEATECSERDVFVNWLPQFHDLGLVNTILLPAYLGSKSILISPIQFVQRPIFWLEAISHYKGNICGGPNFAFSLCAEAIKKYSHDSLDLRSWRIAFNAAETIQASTLDKFTRKFSRYGFVKEAFYPSYGMAEATVFLTGGKPSAPPVVNNFAKKALLEGKAILSARSTKRLVGCGWVQSKHHLKIVNPDTGYELEDGKIGEIWVNGPSIAKGYWNQEEETKKNFLVSMEGVDEPRMLRTGDLGFIYGKILYVTGRKKELIINRGNNYYPTDIEETVQKSHDALRLGAGAAFSVEVEEEERLVIVQEVNRTALRELNTGYVFSVILKSIAQEHQISAYAIVLIKPGSIAKTSSGKIQRGVCKERYCNNTLLAVSKYTQGQLFESDIHMKPRTEEECTLCNILCDELRIQKIGVNDNFFAHGANSIVLIGAVAKINKVFKMDIPINSIFENSSIGKLSRYIRDTKIRKDSNYAITEYRPISRIDRGKQLLLSYSQQRLWFLWKLEGASPVYNESLVLKVRGDLNCDRLIKCIQQIISRHEILSARFIEQDDKIFQDIEVSPDYNFKTEDIADKEQLNNILEAEYNYSFDLSREPLIRFRILKLQDAYVLVITMHHIVVDGWSIGILTKEIESLYNAYSQGVPNPLKPLTIQYVDFAHWQKDKLTKSIFERQIAYWKKRLAGAPPVHSLPLDKPRPVRQSFSGRLYVQRLEKIMLDELHKLARAHEVSLFIVLQSAFALLLSRWSGESDIVMGCPVAGRTHQDTEPLVGFFVNMLVFRTDFSSNAGFKTLLDRTRNSALEAFANQAIPFEKVVERLHPQRSLSHAPVFQVVFDLHNNTRFRLNLPNLHIEPVLREKVHVKFDLELVAEESDEGLVLNWKYAESLFELDSIQRLGESFDALLRGVVDNPELEATKLPLLAQADRNLLEQWNKTQVDYTKEKCIHELFEEQVEHTPNAIAVIFETQRLTYKQLNERANQLAHYLREEGVKPDSLVGLCVERSLEMIVGLLGVLKAGGAYVPIDPEYPRERIDYILNESKVEIILTQHSLRMIFSEGKQRLALLDRELLYTVLPKYFNKNIEKESINLESNNVAYVIYTSGSTGMPKGVQLIHKGLVNLTLDQGAMYAVDESSKVLQFASLSFDAATWEWTLALTKGATLQLCRSELRLQADRFSDFMVETKITHALLPPVLLTHLSLDKNYAFQALVVGGEAGEEGVVKAWAKRYPVYNAYGPTEATVCATVGEIFPDRAITIGKALSNVQLYVLNENCDQQPIGVVGELYIGGVGLAKNYLNDPELTSEKFIRNPFDKRDNSRLYKSGDLVRWLADGNLEFVGRVDNQVKIRGVRIELGEIESNLAKFEKIRNCIVSAREDHNGNVCLVAYLVLDQTTLTMSKGQSLEENQVERVARVKSKLRESLPAYLIPDVFLILEDLPLNPNGKVDHGLLPKPRAEDFHKTEYIPPRNKLEYQLTLVWQELLGVDRVGVTDNFFDLGGHSLLIVKLGKRLASIVKGYTFSVVELFNYPSIRSLCDYIEAQSKKGSASVVRVKKPSASSVTEIAIIGMAGKFPNAKDIDTFWGNLVEGLESVEVLSNDELAERGVDQQLINNDRYVKSRVRFDGADSFDNDFFDINEGHAATLDPQNRLLLECAVHSLENAGYPREPSGMRTGVFVGKSSNYSWVSKITRNLGSTDPVSFMALLTQTEKDFPAAHISFHLNLTGPSLNLSNACSTSLVTVVEASKSLLLGDCDIALAGGVSYSERSKSGYLPRAGFIQSTDGHCRPFDRDATGTIDGCGVGLVVLKRLDDAKRDGDSIHAIIRGWGINNDGANKTGFAAPSVEGQASAISSAYVMSGIDPATIQYIETHGTGTYIGDPIEIAGINKAFQITSEKQIPRGSCLLGAVKANIGHLDAAAGIAGLIKTVSALKNKKIPPNVNYKNPNPELNLEHTPFRINRDAIVWDRGDDPRRAGVSSFGIGGTNVHVILEEAPYICPTLENNVCSNRRYLLTLSAKTETALSQMKSNLAKYLDNHRDIRPEDVAYTLQEGRMAYPYRYSCSFDDLQVVKETLRQRESCIQSSYRVNFEKEVIFMFPGQGSQYSNMLCQYYLHCDVYRLELERCIKIFSKYIDIDLMEHLYPSGKLSVKEANNSCSRQQTEFVQPALFCVEYALAKYWLSLGVEPKAMIGHSLGEYVAACLAGVFCLEDAVKIISQRSRLMQSLKQGTMVSIEADRSTVDSILQKTAMSLAAINGENSLVLSGQTKKADQLIEYLSQNNIAYHILPTSHAFHSEMVDSILPDFEKVVNTVSLSYPKIPFVSNVTGTWITEREAVDAGYWIKHLRQTVQFYSGVVSLIQENKNCLYLEVGPGRVLSGMFWKIDARSLDSIIPSDCNKNGSADDSDDSILGVIGSLWEKGVQIKWSEFYQESQPRRIPLPGYPFEIKSHELKSMEESQQRLEDILCKDGKRFDIDDCFYIPIWRIADIKPKLRNQMKNTLMFIHDSMPVKDIIERYNFDITEVEQGERYKKVGSSKYTINPHNYADYFRLFSDLKKYNKFPDSIVHLWNFSTTKFLIGLKDLNTSQALGLYSALYIARSLGELGLSKNIDLNFVTNSMFSVAEGEVCDPVRSGISAVSKIISIEYKKIKCKNIDVEYSDNSNLSMEIARQLHAELLSGNEDKFVAYRNGLRFIPSVEQVVIDQAEKNNSRLRDSGVYLILGGLGGMGLAFANYIAKEVDASILLVSRSSFPKREQWDEILKARKTDTCILDQINRIKEIESRGSNVYLFQADISDYKQMQQIVNYSKTTFGLINGIVHSAGVVDYGGIIQRRDKESIERYTASKIIGTLVIEELLGHTDLDFMVMGSSLGNTAYQVKYGQVGYVIANEFLESFANYKATTSKVFTTTISWDDWYEKGMSSRIKNLEMHNERRRYSLLNSEGEEIFGRVLSSRYPRVVVSTRDLCQFINKTSNNIDNYRVSDTQVSSDIAPNEQKFDTIEAVNFQVIEALKSVLGIKTISSEANFVALGGDSMLALQLRDHLEKRLGIRIGVEDIYTESSVKEISSRFFEQMNGSSIVGIGKNNRMKERELTDREYGTL